MNISALLEKDRRIVVGVLNVTPDSFSDGGCYFDLPSAIAHAEELVRQGAVVIDIGGESTGPGSQPVSTQEEQRRILPVVTALASKVCLSIDTYHSESAKAALEAGAQIINDVSALRADPKMAAVVAASDAHLVLMYCKDSPLPHVTATQRTYKDVIADISEFFAQRIAYALSEGVKREKIILDPGMGGFVSSDANLSWQLLARLKELKNNFADFPLLVGTSRKGFLGGKLEDRDPISQLTALWAIEHGAKLIRTHNPAMLLEFIDAQQQLAGLKR